MNLVYYFFYLYFIFIIKLYYIRLFVYIKIIIEYTFLLLIRGFSLYLTFCAHIGEKFYWNTFFCMNSVPLFFLNIYMTFGVYNEKINMCEKINSRVFFFHYMSNFFFSFYLNLFFFFLFSFLFGKKKLLKKSPMIFF